MEASYVELEALAMPGTPSRGLDSQSLFTQKAPPGRGDAFCVEWPVGFEKPYVYEMLCLFLPFRAPNFVRLLRSFS